MTSFKHHHRFGLARGVNWWHQHPELIGVVSTVILFAVTGPNGTIGTSRSTTVRG
jgi:hypothetical protein